MQVNTIARVIIVNKGTWIVLDRIWTWNPWLEIGSRKSNIFEVLYFIEKFNPSKMKEKSVFFIFFGHSHFCILGLYFEDKVNANDMKNNTVYVNNNV